MIESWRLLQELVAQADSSRSFIYADSQQDDSRSCSFPWASGLELGGTLILYTKFKDDERLVSRNNLRNPVTSQAYSLDLVLWLFPDAFAAVAKQRTV